MRELVYLSGAQRYADCALLALRLFIGSGLLTRWGALLCIINFIVAIAMVDRFAGVRGAFPSACLIAIGLYLATYGAGRLSLDSLLMRRAS